MSARLRDPLIGLQRLDFTVDQGVRKTIDLSSLAGREFIAVDNPGTYWIHFPDIPGALAWVPPTTFGWVTPLPHPAPAQLVVNTIDVPVGYSLDTTNLAASASITIFAGFPQISLGVQQLISTKGGNATNTIQVQNVKSAPFNAKGDGVTDDTAAIRAAIAAAGAAGWVYLPTGVYLISQQTTELELLLFGHPIHFTGDGYGSVLLVKTGTGAGVDVIHVNPATANTADATMYLFEDFRIVPQAGTPARHAFNLDTTALNTFIRRSRIHRVWTDQLGADAVHLTNPLPTTGVFTVVLDDNFFTGGVNLGNVGDSVTLADNVITGNGKVTIANLGGAALVVLERNNITCSGGVEVDAAISTRIRENNMQLSVAFTGSNAAFVNLTGSTSALLTSEVESNVISVLAGGGAVDALRVDIGQDTMIDKNHFTAPVGQACIRLTANALRTKIGNGNVYLGAAAAIVNAGGLTQRASPHLLYSQVADSAAIGNSVAETAFNKSFVIPGGTLQAGDVIKIRAAGVYSTVGAGPPTLLLRLRLGGAEICANTFLTVAGQAGTPFVAEAEVVVRSVGAAGQLESGQGLLSIATATGIGVIHDAPVLDTTGNLTADMTVQWSVANAANTATLKVLRVELLRAGTSN